MTGHTRQLARSPRRIGRQSLAALAILFTASCSNGAAVQTIDVALKSGDIFEYPTVGGDEEGARIVTQAQHFALSEIRRNAQTNWVAIYVYQPRAGFAGSDRAEIAVLTGSDGASPPQRVSRVVFRFTVSD